MNVRDTYAIVQKWLPTHSPKFSISPRWNRWLPVALTRGGQWALRFPAPKSIKFFALTQGACWTQIDGEAPVRFERGDVGLLTAERPYTVSSDPSVAPLDAMALFSRRGRSFVTLGNGTDCSYLGGHVLLDPTSGTLLSEALPPWLRIDGATEQAERFRWLLDELVNERAQRLPGNALVHRNWRSYCSCRSCGHR